MPIVARCPHCAATYKLAPEAAGREAKCKCGTLFVVRAMDEGATARDTVKPPTTRSESSLPQTLVAHVPTGPSPGAPGLFDYIGSIGSLDAYCSRECHLSATREVVRGGGRKTQTPGKCAFCGRPLSKTNTGQGSTPTKSLHHSDRKDAHAGTHSEDAIDTADNQFQEDTGTIDTPETLAASRRRVGKILGGIAACLLIATAVLPVWSRTSAKAHLRWVEVRKHIIPSQVIASAGPTSPLSVGPAEKRTALLVTDDSETKVISMLVTAIEIPWDSYPIYDEPTLKKNNRLPDETKQMVGMVGKYAVIFPDPSLVTLHRGPDGPEIRWRLWGTAGTNEDGSPVEAWAVGTGSRTVSIEGGDERQDALNSLKKKQLWPGSKHSNLFLFAFSIAPDSHPEEYYLQYGTDRPSPIKAVLRQHSD